MRRWRWPHGRTAKKLIVAYHFARSGGWQREEYDCGKCNQQGFYLKRNCRKYHSNRPPVDYRWTPDYRTEQGGIVNIEVEARECPVSLLADAPELRSLIHLDTRNRQVQKATGAAMFGPDSSLWPAVWFDAVAVLQTARDEEEAARLEAIHNAH